MCGAGDVWVWLVWRHVQRSGMESSSVELCTAHASQVPQHSTFLLRLTRTPHLCSGTLYNTQEHTWTLTQRMFYN